MSARSWWRQVRRNGWVDPWWWDFFLGSGLGICLGLVGIAVIYAVSVRLP